VTHPQFVEVEPVPLDEALEKWASDLGFLELARPTEEELVTPDASLGRIAAAPVTALQPSPLFYVADRDGMAVCSQHTFRATPDTPLTLKVGQDAIFIDIGHPIPNGFDAIIPIHEVGFRSLEEVVIIRPASPWQHIRPQGEDVAAREIIVQKGERIGALHVGAMLAGGVEKVVVHRRPVLGILPVGSALVPPGSEPVMGQRIETNAAILKALTREWGGDAQVATIVPEDLSSVRAALASLARDCDLVVPVAGPIWGTNLVAQALLEEGELLLAGVNVKPGRSVCLGSVAGRPVVVLPGYAVSAYLTFRLFARPVLNRMLDVIPSPDLRQEAILARRVESPPGVEEILRLKLGCVDDRVVALPISRGADILMSIVRADGLLRVPADVSALPQGMPIEVELLRPEKVLDGTIIILGSHDIALEILRNQVLLQCPDLDFFSANLGSHGGFEALRQGLCHVAGLHLFDPETGEFNWPYLKRHEAEFPVCLVNLFVRQIGFMVKRGNPVGITSLGDLARPGITFINRNLGSGTRGQFDFHLKKAGIEPAAINGYSNEAFTHISLAATIAGGSADVGIGIKAAATAQGLDFIPLFCERFDLAIPRRMRNHYLVQSLLGVIGSTPFHKEVEALGGYDLSLCGRFLQNGEG